MAMNSSSARKFRLALIEIGMSQSAFAREVGVGDRHVRRFASGEAEVPKLVWMAIELLNNKRRENDERSRRVR